jgi:RHS repeat-associated protein
VDVVQGQAQTLYFVHADHLNTPRLVADATGTTVWRWDQQEPFGNNPADENPSGLGAFDLPLRLPGQHYDKETGLHYNYFRDYDPSIGKYGESDPIGLRGGLNTYAYVSGAPLTRTDPSGLQGVATIPEAGLVITIGCLLTPGCKEAMENVAKQIAEACKTKEEKDACLDRWEKEDKDCDKWTGFGHRWVRACKDRAAHRLRLCYRNGGTPDPNEPEVWRPD